MTKLRDKIERDFPTIVREADQARAAGRDRPEHPSALWLAAERHFEGSLGPRADEICEKMREPMRDFLLMQAMNKAHAEVFGNI